MALGGPGQGQSPGPVFVWHRCVQGVNVLIAGVLAGVLELEAVLI